MDEIVYLNHAATSWPKPERVYQAVDQAMRAFGSPKRGAATGTDPVESTRTELASLLNAPDAQRIIFQPGCTYALNTAIQGLDWEPDDVCVISSLEHHAVSRPARKIARERGVRLEVVPYAPGNPFDLNFLEQTLKNGRVRLVACTMASNVTGELTPIREIIKLAKSFGALTLVDAAQAAGVIRIDVQELGADLLGFAGHKGLLGPLGVGGLYIAPGISVNGVVEGGTGGDSGVHELAFDRPASYEVGTINAPAIAGLGAGLEHIKQTGLESMIAHEARLLDRLLEGLALIEGVRVLGPGAGQPRTSAVTFEIEGCTDPKAAAAWLMQHHRVVCRAGFHCAPLAHQSIGTAKRGALRLSPGWSTTEAQIDHGINAILDLNSSIRSR